jgi:Fur family zinc uptake transcriptional regulator
MLIPPKKTSRTGMRAAKPPKAKTRHSHDHDNHVHEASPKLGVNETRVHKILTKAKKPLSAYDIIPLMNKTNGHAVAPVTVYRALKQLTDHGLVTRIESRNAYVLCQHPHEKHDCLFFICRACGNAIEAPDSQIRPLLRKEAATLGFDINKQILEIVGLCKDCAAPP